jgi:hypothetical protein
MQNGGTGEQKYFNLKTSMGPEKSFATILRFKKTEGKIQTFTDFIRVVAEQVMYGCK